MREQRDICWRHSQVSSCFPFAAPNSATSGEPSQLSTCGPKRYSHPFQCLKCSHTFIRQTMAAKPTSFLQLCIPGWNCCCGLYCITLLWHYLPFPMTGYLKSGIINIRKNNRVQSLLCFFWAFPLLFIAVSPTQNLTAFLNNTWSFLSFS